MSAHCQEVRRWSTLFSLEKIIKNIQRPNDLSKIKKIVLVKKKILELVL